MRTPAALLLIALLAGLPAAAQDPGDEPVPPPTEGPAPTRAEAMGYYDRCFGVPQVGVNPIGIYGEVGVPIGGGRGGGGAGAPAPLLGGSSDEKAWLVVAVIAVAALPVVVWAVDSEPDRVVLARWRCPTFSFEYAGGMQTSNDELGGAAHAVQSGRLAFGYETLALDLQFDASPGAVSDFATHLLLRPPPKQHVEGGLAIGYRRARFHGLAQEGLEVGLPHRYTFWRDGLRTVGLELRPMLLFSGQGVEPGLHGAVLLPLHQVLHLRAGGGVFTFGGSLFWTVQGGLLLTL